ncbi:MAG: hypothetical protein FWE45_00890 [Firmicutes bacterium]|nr:hypothetical protein [Bacillota bacterium]
MFKVIWAKKFLILFLVALIAVLPMAMTKQPLALSQTIVTALGIDKINGEYKVVCEHIIFNFDPFGVMERELVTATAPSIDDAFNEIGRSQGRTISFSHCTIIILGDGLREENFADLLKPFLLKSTLSNSAVLLYTDDDIEELMQASIEIGDVRSAKLQQIAEFNRQDNRFTSTSLERFFKDSLGRNRMSKITKVRIGENDTIENEGEYVTLSRGLIQT